MEEEVIKIIDDLRPFLMNDGGNIEFVKLEDNIVYIRLQGACLYCNMQDFTIKDGIERIIKEKISKLHFLVLIHFVIQLFQIFLVLF